MPYEEHIRWIALALLSLAAVWLVLAAVGLCPRALRLKGAIGRCESASLLCGACGHPAVSLGQIESCPECGCLYARVGLDGPGTPVRWSPPVFVLAVMLLGVWLLASVWLAPMAARWANQRTIGSAQLERWQSRAGLVPTNYDPATRTLLPVAAELERDLIGPATLPAGSTRRAPLWGTITLRLSHGPTVPGAESVWRQSTAAAGHSVPAGPVPAPTVAGLLTSPWDAMHANEPTATLRWSVASDAWTLTDTQNGPRAMGAGLDAGVVALAVRVGVDAIDTAPGAPRPGLGESVALAAKPKFTDQLHTLREHEGVVMGFGTMRVVGEVTAIPTRMAIHPAAPWGLAAAIATTALLALVAAMVCMVAWRSRRRAAHGPAQRARATSP